MCFPAGHRLALRSPALSLLQRLDFILLHSYRQHGLHFPNNDGSLCLTMKIYAKTLFRLKQLKSSELWITLMVIKTESVSSIVCTQHKIQMLLFTVTPQKNVC